MTNIDFINSHFDIILESDTGKLMWVAGGMDLVRWIFTEVRSAPFNIYYMYKNAL